MKLSRSFTSMIPYSSDGDSLTQYWLSSLSTTVRNKVSMAFKAVTKSERMR